MLKDVFVLEVLTFLSWLFGDAKNWLDKKAKVNFKIFDVTDWTVNNYNTHTEQHLQKYRQSDNEIWSVNKIKHEKYFLKNHVENKAGRLVSDLFSVFLKSLILGGESK